MSAQHPNPQKAVAKRYYTTEEAAVILQLDKRTLQNWRYVAKPDGPPYVHIGGAVRYPVQAFNEWCDELDSQASNDPNTHRNQRR
ncbi:helix-turn-helix domain-containing protein [Glutamicibacter nicotianae]|uniref:helix-turn-helix domain-containing protein n=1 Tax=Glutamicibacter nicotianae TaxID=37929 RepID=UPI00255575D5|nr:helix-turn-helix domain-containing protein [Glutamicibacter nicotianae]WIV43058.1 helix-turn-helix domain-containing protein [Glutamicibacter nicotianae]